MSETVCVRTGTTSCSCYVSARKEYIVEGIILEQKKNTMATDSFDGFFINAASTSAEQEPHDPVISSERAMMTKIGNRKAMRAMRQDLPAAVKRNGHRAGQGCHNDDAVHANRLRLRALLQAKRTGKPQLVVATAADGSASYTRVVRPPGCLTSKANDR